MHRDRISLCALYAGIAVPCLYFGVQAVAAPFFSEFSFVGTTASELGSERSSHPAVFNYGTLLLGVAWLIASVGFFRAFQRLGVHPVLAWPVSAAFVVAGIGSFFAGWYPLPDPRHSGHPAFLIAILSLPILLTVALWKKSHPVLRAYFVANLVLLAVMVPIMGGFTGLDTHTYRGLFQRMFALTVFLPVGITSAVLARRIIALPESCDSRWEGRPAILQSIGQGADSPAR
jgi:hypothetical membrane protein